MKTKKERITDLNTDVITCTFSDDQCPFDIIDDKNINIYYWDDEKTIPKYKLEQIGKHVKYPKMEKYMRKDKYVLENSDWNITPDVEDYEFKPLINKLLVPINLG